MQLFISRCICNRSFFSLSVSIHICIVLFLPLQLSNCIYYPTYLFTCILSYIPLYFPSLIPRFTLCFWPNRIRDIPIFEVMFAWLFHFSMKGQLFSAVKSHCAVGFQALHFAPPALAPALCPAPADSHFLRGLLIRLPGQRLPTDPLCPFPRPARHLRESLRVSLACVRVSPRFCCCFSSLTRLSAALPLISPAQGAFPATPLRPRQKLT